MFSPAIQCPPFLYPRCSAGKCRSAVRHAATVRTRSANQTTRPHPSLGGMHPSLTRCSPLRTGYATFGAAVQRGARTNACQSHRIKDSAWLVTHWGLSDGSCAGVEGGLPQPCDPL